MYQKRTDLALEAHEMWKESTAETSKLPGVKAEDYNKEGFNISKIEILDEQGEKELNKPGENISPSIWGRLTSGPQTHCRKPRTSSPGNSRHCRST